MPRLSHVHYAVLAVLAVVVFVKCVFLYDVVHENAAHLLAHTEGPLLFTVAATGWVAARRKGDMMTATESDWSRFFRDMSLYITPAERKSQTFFARARAERDRTNGEIQLPSENTD